MSKKSKSKYYVVWVGQNPGIYDTWTECQNQIKGFPNAKYKSFNSKSEAESAFKESAASHITSKNIKNKSDLANRTFPSKEGIIEDSISVDAACSGNPGMMEYRAVFTKDSHEIFRMGPFPGGTNNIGEYLALVHILALLNAKNDYSTIIYSDSRTAMSWLKNKKVKTTLKPNSNNQAVFTLIKRAEKWVNENPIKNKVLKWDTKNWGEIPADFGRK